MAESDVRPSGENDRIAEVTAAANTAAQAAKDASRAVLELVEAAKNWSSPACQRAGEAADAPRAAAQAAMAKAPGDDSFEPPSPVEEAANDAEAAASDECKKAIDLVKRADAEKAEKARARAEGLLAAEIAKTIRGAPPILPHLAERLLNDVRSGVYNELATYALCVASAWAYSDAELLKEAMDFVGFEVVTPHTLLPSGLVVEEPASKTVRNDALLVETTATLLQSKDGKVVILCFRGTEPTNALTWLSDATFEMERFYSSGNVHSGFYRSLTPAWPFIDSGLDDAMAGRIITPAQKVGLFGGGGPDERRKVSPMEAFYITGHSLGGALAALATAMLYQKPKYACVRERLRGIYTFGQPFIGDQEFADTCEEDFGHMLFRHVYEKDIITHYPPRLYGAFRTFGQEYVSTADGWTHRKPTLRQTYTLLASAILGGLAWGAEQIPLLRNVHPVLSLADHSPVNYVKCSRLSLPFYG